MREALKALDVMVVQAPFEGDAAVAFVYHYSQAYVDVQNKSNMESNVRVVGVLANVCDSCL